MDNQVEKQETDLYSKNPGENIYIKKNQIVKFILPITIRFFFKFVLFYFQFVSGKRSLSEGLNGVKSQPSSSLKIDLQSSKKVFLPSTVKNVD